MALQVKRVVIIGTSVIFFGTTLSMKTKIGALWAGTMCRWPALACRSKGATVRVLYAKLPVCQLALRTPDCATALCIQSVEW